MSIDTVTKKIPMYKEIAKLLVTMEDVDHEISLIKKVQESIEEDGQFSNINLDILKSKVGYLKDYLDELTDLLNYIGRLPK